LELPGMLIFLIGTGREWSSGSEHS